MSGRDHQGWCGTPQTRRQPNGEEPVADARHAPLDADGNSALPQPFTFAYSVDVGPHAEIVLSVVFTNDVLAIATSAVAPRIADARTGALIRTLVDPGYFPMAHGLAACRDGTRIVASSPNKATFVHRLMATAAADGDDATAPARAAAEPTRLQARDVGTWAVDITRCGRLCAVGDDAGVVRVCDSATGDVVKTLRTHSSTVIAMAFSPDGTWLLSTSSDATAALTRLCLDDTSGDRAAAPNGAGLDETSVLRVEPAHWCRSAVFSPCGSLLALADVQHVVHVLSALDGTTVQTLPNSDRVSCIAFSPCGTLIATGGAGPCGAGHTRLWRLRDAEPLHDFSSPAMVSTVAFHPSGELLACGAHFPVVVYHVPRSPSRLM